MTIEDFKKLNLPDTPGVYMFVVGKEIVYVGKATSLHDRVRSYFSTDLFETRGPVIAKMITEADDLRFETTDSVLEALILEAKYIKKFQPRCNSLSKDDKSYNYVVITKEKWPRILLMRERELEDETSGLSAKIAKRFVAGPFPHGLQLKEAMKIVRRIFPYRDNKCVPAEEQPHPPKFHAEILAGKPCFNYQIGLCPGVCVGAISNADYKKTIKNIILFFEGKKTHVIKNLEKEMKILAKDKHFEEAQKVRNKIFALNHIQDVALLKRRQKENEKSLRIEAYDIAHMSGKETVGVMVVIENGEPNKSEYRKFKIRGLNARVTIDDTKNLEEVIARRLMHRPPAGGWELPDIVVVDGAQAQINIAEKILKENNLNIPVVSVVKDSRHKPMRVLGDEKLISKNEKAILLANAEAHRFAIAFHRKRLRHGL